MTSPISIALRHPRIETMLVQPSRRGMESHALRAGMAMNPDARHGFLPAPALEPCARCRGVGLATRSSSLPTTPGFAGRHPDSELLISWKSREPACGGQSCQGNPAPTDSSGGLARPNSCQACRGCRHPRRKSRSASGILPRRCRRYADRSALGKLWPRRQTGRPQSSYSNSRAAASSPGVAITQLPP